MRAPLLSCSNYSIRSSGLDETFTQGGREDGAHSDKYDNYEELQQPTYKVIVYNTITLCY